MLAKTDSKKIAIQSLSTSEPTTHMQVSVSSDSSRVAVLPLQTLASPGLHRSLLLSLEGRVVPQANSPKQQAAMIEILTTVDVVMPIPRIAIRHSAACCARSCGFLYWNRTHCSGFIAPNSGEFLSLSETPSGHGSSSSCNLEGSVAGGSATP